jgi:hypothetical protein
MIADIILIRIAFFALKIGVAHPISLIVPEDY